MRSKAFSNRPAAATLAARWRSRLSAWALSAAAAAAPGGPAAAIRNLVAVVLYASMALNTVPFIAPEYGEAAMQIYDSLGAISIGLNATPYVASATSNLTKQVDNALQFGIFGVLNTPSRYITHKNCKTKATRH